MTILIGKFIYDEFLQEFLDILEVGHVATRADNGVFANWVESLDILEAGKGSVGSCGIL